MAIKKGPTKGSGGKHRNALRGKGPTPKAEDRVYHKAYKAKQATNRRKMADPRLAARRRAAKFTSDSDDLVIGRNAVLEALRVGVPSMQLYIATRIEHDDRTREIIKLAGAQSLHLLEADRLEMDRIARSSNHQGVVLKVQPYQYSSLAELADIAERKAKADSQIADAAKLRTEAEAMKAEYEQNLQNARTEANQIVATAQKTATARSEEIVGEARAQAAALKQKAEADIAQERKKAVNEAKDEIGGMAMEIASKVVEREIKEADHKDLIDEFIKNVGEAS